MTKPKREKRRNKPEIMLETFRRVFGTDSPSASIACERPATLRLINSVYDEILREQKETNQ